MTDLFGHVEAVPLRVRLDRAVDREHPCCNNVATVGPGKAQHAGELRCETCGKHRGWIAHEAFDFLVSVTQKFGAPPEPIRLGDRQIGEYTMSDEKKYPNSGILFRNRDKDPSDTRDRDYKGEALVGGIGYWVSGWIKEGKSGKFLTFSFKPKDAPKDAAPKSAAADFNDEVRF